MYDRSAPLSEEQIKKMTIHLLRDVNMKLLAPNFETIANVLNGDILLHGLVNAFNWRYTPQGFNYWRSIHLSELPMGDEDWDFLKLLLTFQSDDSKLNTFEDLLERRQKRIIELEQALDFYADENNWKSRGHLQIDRDLIPVLRDNGERARKLLRS